MDKMVFKMKRSLGEAHFKHCVLELRHQLWKLSWEVDLDVPSLAVFKAGLNGALV